MNLAVYISIFLAAFPNIHATEKYTTTDGIIYEYMGDVKVTNTHWILNYRISIKEFMLHSFKLKECKQSINSLCKKLDNDSNCLYFKKFIDSNERLLTLQLKKLKSISNRQKRLFATINVAFALTMEWIKEWIFGDTNNDKIEIW